MTATHHIMVYPVVLNSKNNSAVCDNGVDRVTKLVALREPGERFVRSWYASDNDLELTSIKELRAYMGKDAAKAVYSARTNDPTVQRPLFAPRSHP